MVVTRGNTGSLPKRAAVVVEAVVAVATKRTVATKRVKPEEAEQDGVKKSNKKTKLSEEEKKAEVKEEAKEKGGVKRKKEVKVEAKEVELKEEGAGKKKKAAAKKVKVEAVTVTGPSPVYGANAFALDLRSKRRWESPPLKEEAAVAFKEALLAHNILPDHIVPHGSYLINAGSADPELLVKSRAALVDEGSTCGLIENDECIKNIGDSINHVHEHTKGVTILVEAMAGQGSTVGGKFAHLRDIISHVKDKTRVGVCLDSCHIFAAGYDIRTKETYEAVMTEFDQTVGMHYLKAWHINDSKTPLGGLKDRHEHLGKGFIGLETFRLIMNDPRMAKIPLILETPECDYSIEINLLRSMVVNK